MDGDDILIFTVMNWIKWITSYLNSSNQIDSLHITRVLCSNSQEESWIFQFLVCKCFYLHG